MRFICDNSYFLEGVKEYINPGKFIISGMQTDNVVIISSSRISEIVGFLYKNNISDANTLYFSSPEALRFLWGVVDSPVYDIRHLTERCSVNDINHLYRAFMSVEKLTLSGRQVNVLMMLLYGSNGTEGARYLGMSEKTFSTHKQNLIKRLRVHNEVELLYKGMLLVRKGRL
ncbi:LuxR C-terminal-related transcriptional regulator [Escherichia coli]